MNTTALAKIRADMDRHRDLFDLESEGLGVSLCKAATDGVRVSIDSQCEPDGTPWAPLSEPYEKWKGKQFPGQPMAILHKIMANPKEVAGEVAVTKELASVTYGTTAQARQEAIWFQEGAGRPGHGAPARPFWGFTERSLGEVALILDSRFATA